MFWVELLQEVGGAHVDFGAETEMRCPAGGVEVIDDSLALAEHAEDGSDERLRRKIVLGKVGVAEQHAVAGRWVI